LDNLNPYDDPALKRARLARLEPTAAASGTNVELIQADLEDATAVSAAFDQHRPARVVNLAAQAGVRYSLENPAAYIQANLVGFGHSLEGCRFRSSRGATTP
jgi:UDP-glucuronate 4-epimerase